MEGGIILAVLFLFLVFGFKKSVRIFNEIFLNREIKRKL